MEKHKIALYPDKDLYDWIKESADEEERSINKYVLMILRFAQNHPDVLNPNAV